jgi:hypothetical protein
MAYYWLTPPSRAVFLSVSLAVLALRVERLKRALALPVLLASTGSQQPRFIRSASTPQGVVRVENQRSRSHLKATRRSLVASSA